MRVADSEGQEHNWTFIPGLHTKWGLHKTIWEKFLAFLLQILRESSHLKILVLHLGENHLVKKNRMALT